MTMLLPPSSLAALPGEIPTTLSARFPSVRLKAAGRNSWSSSNLSRGETQVGCLCCSWLHPPCRPGRPGPLSSPYPCAVFDAVDPELHRDVEAVQEVASKN